jgi:hypothetical protein
VKVDDMTTRMAALKSEFQDEAGKGSHSSWEEFLGHKLCVAEDHLQMLSDGIMEIGVSVGVVDGKQPLTGPQVLQVISEIKQWIASHPLKNVIVLSADEIASPAVQLCGRARRIP